MEDLERAVSEQVGDGGLHGFLTATSGHTEPGLYLLVWCSFYCLEWGVRSEQGAESIPVGTRPGTGSQSPND